MQDMNDKINDGGATSDGQLSSTEWNQPASEIQKVIEALGIALSAGDLNQLGKGIAGYVANGNFYTDSGAADAYVLTTIGNKQTLPEYTDGMIVEFLAGNTNAGASTVNVAGLGVKNIVDTSGGGEIIVNARYILRYRVLTDDFEIIKIVAAGLLFGLGLSNAADADHDITIATGEASDSTNSFLLNLTTALTKQIDAGWAVGNNAGGLFSGSVAVDTWYHTFLIRKDSDGSIDAGFDTSVTAANIPAGYTAFRRLGSVLTDGSANILPFLQRGNNFIFDVPINEHNAVVGTGSGTSVTISTPFEVKTEAILFAASTSLAVTTLYMRISNVEATDLAVTFSSATHVNGDTNAGWRSGGIIEVFTDLGSHIRARTDLSSNVVINTLGYNDDRGQS